MIGKCNTGGGENLTTQLNNQDAIITELEAKVHSVSGVDMATPVNAQTLTIEQIQESLVGKAQGANATAETILKGFSAYVGQELVEGTYEPITGIEFGEITVASNNNSDIVVNHSLGVTPSFALITPKTTVPLNNSIYSQLIQASNKMYTNTGSVSVYGTNFYSHDNTAILDSNAITFTLKNSSSMWIGGVTYLWIALA